MQTEQGQTPSGASSSISDLEIELDTAPVVAAIEAIQRAAQNTAEGCADPLFSALETGEKLFEFRFEWSQRDGKSVMKATLHVTERFRVLAAKLGVHDV